MGPSSPHGGVRLHRSLVAVAAIALLVPPAAAGRAATAPVRVAFASGDAATGGVTIEGGAAFTRHAIVTVAIPAPTTSAGVVRLSNDGATWVTTPYAETVRWSLTEGAGGDPNDGVKVVRVEQSDLSGGWVDVGTDAITLDTTPPGGHVAIDGGAGTSPDWVVSVDGSAIDNGSGIAAERVSLDGSHWSHWTPPGGDHIVQWHQIDLRTLMWGGDWSTGTRSVYVQRRDVAGNDGAVVKDDITIAARPTLHWSEGPLDVRFAFPHRPVTGEPFTIAPVFPSGFVMPSDAHCEWVLFWGDEQALYQGPPNETWGEIIMERSAARGGCQPWTFTLPYTSERRYRFMFKLLRKQPGADWGNGQELYISPTHRQMEFHAELGSTDRHIRESSIPIAYLLPTTELVKTGGSMTYRLHATDATTPPQTGTFWAYPLGCYINPHLSQEGGTTFTFEASCSGSWVAGWTGTYHGGYMRTQYDPIADGQAPVVAVPTVRLAPAAPFGSAVVATVSWTGQDAHSAVDRYELAMSVDGGAYTPIALPARLATVHARGLAAGRSYRFRVRARDRAGNCSGWRYTAAVRPAVVEQSDASIRWSPGWATHAHTSWSRGSARYATAAGARATSTFTGRGVAWVARTGPGRTLVEVYLDGRRVRTVDLRASVLGPRRTVFAHTWPTVGTHTIEIRSLGTVGRSRVEVDALLFLR
jgi:hypothetical protein